MLRPGQIEHNSYGFIFQRPEDLLCDELLICYPSQLSGNNTLNGTIRQIPYRLRDKKKNIVNKKCEEKRKEFCKKGGDCLLGKPGSILWHGILVKSEYVESTEIFITTIALSITNKTFIFIFN
ncbi:hypothetical protein Mgra_00007457 [Meloidogyne graminicola]|uniref:Uncharacterized protein n=1 Tax=Meloidogyne graminicola TaxID=189291 RepID=A0A8S9ZIM2_9BILA|nr:hypothetical protein Mgra_00007457 [Meloidogyne graminicola]